MLYDIYHFQQVAEIGFLLLSELRREELVHFILLAQPVEILIHSELFMAQSILIRPQLHRQALKGQNLLLPHIKWSHSIGFGPGVDCTSEVLIFSNLGKSILYDFVLNFLAAEVNVLLRTELGELLDVSIAEEDRGVFAYLGAEGN